MSSVLACRSCQQSVPRMAGVQPARKATTVFSNGELHPSASQASHHSRSPAISLLDFLKGDSLA